LHKHRLTLPVVSSLITRQAIPNCRCRIIDRDQDKSETFGKTNRAISKIEYLIKTPLAVDIRVFKKILGYPGGAARHFGIFSYPPNLRLGLDNEVPGDSSRCPQLRSRKHQQLGGHWRRGQNENKAKEKSMKQLLAFICGATLSVAYAQAQTSNTPSTTTSSPATKSMTRDTSNNTATSSSSGMVTDYTPGAAITLDPGTGQPVHFVIGDKVQIVGPDGKVLAATDIKKNSKVHVRLIQEGGRTVADRIDVE
jgi:hypothetical protein